MSTLTQGDDLLMWDSASSSSFSCKAAWELCRHRAPIQPILRGLWHASFPISTSFFMWKLAKGFLHVDVKLQRMGFSLASKCQCCAQVEDLPHLFLCSPVASAVWCHFGKWIPPLPPLPPTIIEVFLAWQGCSGRQSKGHIRTLIAMCIFKEIWMARNRAKHDNIRMNHRDIIAKVEKKIFILVKAGIIRGKNCKGEKKLKEVLGISQIPTQEKAQRRFRWIKPMVGWYKLNTDGCSKGNPGASAGGGLLRDHHGRLILAFAKYLGINSSFMAELLALHLGLSKCKDLRVESVWIEVDSLSLCRCVNGGVTPNWKSYIIMAEIMDMLSNMRWTCTHIWREGNCAADLLANMATTPNTWLVWMGSTPLHKLNGMLRLDRLGMEYIRVK